MFVRSSGTWSQQAKLIADDGAAFDDFGFSVAISGDTVVVGAPLDDDLGSSSGSAYVFVRSGDSWSQQAKLTAPDGALPDNFGASVAIDGDVVVVGAEKDSDKGGFSGSAYVYVRRDGTRRMHDKLTPDFESDNEHFGVSASVGGGTVIVGAAFGSFINGSVYVFEFSNTAPVGANDAYTVDEGGTIRVGIGVTKKFDGTTEGTLRRAVADAVSGDTIYFDLGGTTGIAVSSPLAIDKDLTIVGPRRNQPVHHKPESTEGRPWGQPLKKPAGASLNLG